MFLTNRATCARVRTPGSSLDVRLVVHGDRGFKKPKKGQGGEGAGGGLALLKSCRSAAIVDTEAGESEAIHDVPFSSGVVGG